MLGKKAQMWRYIIGGVIAIVVLIVVILIFTQRYNQGNNVAKDKIGDVSNDRDCDGVPNFLDKCCDTPPNTEVDVSGCSVEGESAQSCSSLTGLGAACK